jgi:hypothetical protein
MHEAECFVRQYEEETVRSYKYILFYGGGFGYHIEAFARRFVSWGKTLLTEKRAIMQERFRIIRQI